MSGNTNNNTGTPNNGNTTPATIKIAATDPNKRASGGGADPGPGDPSAAPSVAPELVDIPEAPTSSQLVVKSTTKAVSGGASKHSSAVGAQPSTAIPERSGTSMGRGPKSVILSSMANRQARNSITEAGSQAGPAASQPSSAREATSSRALTGTAQGSSQMGSSGLSKGHKSTMSQRSVGGAPKSTTSNSPRYAAPGAADSAATGGQSNSPTTASIAMQADSGLASVHDEVEEGEGEVEQPDGTPTSPKSHVATGLRGSSAMSPSGKASGIGRESSPKSATATSEAPASPSSSAMPSDAKGGKNDKDKKVTRFRYHKRIVVRTHGKTSPATIMDKVNKKDHKAGITPSTIEDLDPQELMKRAGIKGNKQTHWRVRLRQTKRLTKNGKTTTQTKVAYRDSEGNKRVKTSSNPFCKKCNKKLENCKCETDSQSNA